MSESTKQRLKRLRREFNDACMERDGNRCVMCGSRTRPLTVHHISPRHEMENDGYALENGITLCNEVPSNCPETTCHLKAEQFFITDGKNWLKGFHPDDLYRKIGSSYEKAVKACEALK